jgi:tRNA G10  N-methylase Trm11
MKVLILLNQDLHWKDFRFAELDALLKYYNLDPVYVYSREEIFTTSKSYAIEKKHEYVLDELANQEEITFTQRTSPIINHLDSCPQYKSQNNVKDSAFLIAELPSRLVIESICSRSVLIKAVYELWSYGSSFSDILSQLKTLQSSFFHQRIHPSDCVRCNPSWSIQIECYNRSLHVDEKSAYRNELEFLTQYLQGTH